MASTETGPLVKEHLAGQLKSAIVQGRFSSGRRVVEEGWAREFGVDRRVLRRLFAVVLPRMAPREIPI